MRISNYDLNNMMQYYMMTTQGKMAQQNVQLATGKKFQKYSEDPMNGNKSILLDNTEKRITQYQKNISDVKIFLERIDTSMNSAYNMATNAYQEGLRAVNGTFSTSDKQAFAKVVEGSIDNILELANTKYLGKYIFSGQQTQTKPLSYNGVSITYNGDNNAQNIGVSSTLSMDISGDASAIFKPVLDDLINLRDQILTGTNATITAALASLNITSEVLVNERTDAGVKKNTLEGLEGSYGSSLISIKEQRVGVEDIDMAQAVNEYMQTKGVYQATLQATGMISKLSLLNYM